MSTTIPCSSSSARRNVASTTNVAPWSCWAGPNTSPRRLWAIMMWSRIVTANMRSRPAVGDRVAERGQAPLGEPGHHARQLLEARLARDERVEGRVAQELQREREPVLGRAPPGTRRRE